MTLKSLLKPLAVLGAAALLGPVAFMNRSALAAEPPSKPSTTAAAKPAALRLGDAVRPTHYALDLTLIPSEETFSGAVDVDLELREPSSLIRMHGIGFTVKEAVLTSGGDRLTANVSPGADETLGFAFERPVPAGKARLHVAYTGPVSKVETNGFFHQREGGEWYLFSHFEPTDARRAFPCFDEPSFKVPWQLTLHVKREHVAVSNTRPVSESEGEGGMKTVRFAETKPLPSYLVALGVGPFDVVDAGKAGQNGTPVRIIVPKGRAADAKYAAEVTGPLMAVLEKYFGVPFPYEKLDNLVIPQTVGFGAMENAGLVTWASSLILARPGETSAGFKRTYASISAHETSHQWFGDLVTLAWWDDVWLNESFADWAEARTMRTWKPEWSWRLSEVSQASDAMQSDSLASARRIRQPIESKDDIANAFDNITYEKGAAVLTMFEAWLGEAKFQKGVQRYLKTHAHGNGTESDFLSALSAEGGPEVAPAFSTFLDQPGLPLVTAELACGGGGHPAVRLSQKRFLPKAPAGLAKQLWQIPVCVRWGGGAEGRACTLLRSETAALPLAGATSCPGWVLANDGAAGYFRVLYKGSLLTELLKGGGQHLSLPERVSALDDAGALVATGDVSMKDALGLVPVFAKDRNRYVVGSTLDIVDVARQHLVPEDMKPNLARFVRAVYGERAHELGFAPKAGEDDDTRLQRPRLVSLIADTGQDQALAEDAGRLARRWLDDRSAVSADIVNTVLRTAARHGDRALFDRMHAEAKKTQDRRDRGRILSAMGYFRDPATERAALDLILTDEFDTREAMAIARGALDEPDTGAVVYDFVTRNFDALAARLPRDYPAYLPYMATSFCDETHRAQVEEFFKERAKKYTGGPRNLAHALEEISVCSAIKGQQEARVEEFLRAY